MPAPFSVPLWLALLALILAGAAAHAQQACDINGESVNPNNGASTAGKTGLMRCRERDGGPVLREQEIQSGRFMGVVRYYKDGVLERDYSVNERGNREGLSREYAAKPGNNPLLREETLRNGTTVAIARTWYESGQLRRVSFHNDKGQSEAVVEFTPSGRLSELRCAARAQLTPHADDAAWCGHGGAPGKVTLYDGKGEPSGTLTHERGELRYRELLWPNGKPRSQTETTAQGRTERTYAQNGVKRREVQWVFQGDGGDRRTRPLLDREYHESGTLVRERRYVLNERGAELTSEQRWYLNGQLREKTEAIAWNGKPASRDTRYYDNGQVQSEGVYLREARGGRIATGVDKSFDAKGKLRLERHYNERGRVSREREWDESGTVMRDEELFEDGSRKAFAK